MSAMMKIGAAAVGASGYAESELFAGVWGLVMAVRTELFLFAFAMAAYFALFQQRTLTNSKSRDRKDKLSGGDDEEECANTISTKVDALGLGKPLAAAFEDGDYRSVMRQWNSLKRSNGMAAASLPHVVESMQRLKKDTPFILNELAAFFKAFPKDCDMACVNELLESLARRLDSALMEKIVELLHSLGREMDERSCEVFFKMYFTTRNFQDIKALSSKMWAKNIPFTARSLMVLVKTSTKMNNLDEAMLSFRELKKVSLEQGLSPSAPTAPSHVVSDIVECACKEHRLGEVFGDVGGLSLSEEVVHSMLAECVRQKDRALAGSVEKLAREQEVCFTDATYGLLIRCMAADPVRARALFDELVQKGIEVTTDLTGAVLTACATASDVGLAERLYAHMQPKQSSVLSAFISFYAANDEYEKACDVYEKGVAAPEGPASLRLDTRAQRSLMKAAVKCGRDRLAQDLLSASPSDIAKHIAVIRNCASDGNLAGAAKAFESLELSGVEMDSNLYNIMLDACVQCRDLRAAEAWMERTNKAGFADVVSFNTLIKAHLMCGSFSKARCLMEEMSKQGLQPDIFTFNELINATVSKSGDARRKQMWAIVEEMKAVGVTPNQVTISILLKSLTHYSDSTDIVNIMDLIGTMDEPMDEVLLSSVVEACVRIGKPDLLERTLKQLQDSPAFTAISGSHTYGSLIKAYGHAKDIEGVWRCWKELRSRHIKPTSITVGCMTEAIVNQGDSEGAYDLIRQMQDDTQCRDCLNAVIYCSVLKGFAREKKIDRVWAVYQDMRSRKVEASIAMYNTLIDACARCGRMERLPEILEDMRSNLVSPNLITYSTMLKGHCQNGHVSKGFQILEQMKSEQDTSLRPDERMYNSLLDGCAQDGLVEQGLRLLEGMQAEGVRPSNFTLSVLVKLLTRARKLEQAFALVADITKKYNFGPNVHVYNNLVHGCVANKQIARGRSVLEEMVSAQIEPDSRTYATLVRASISNGLFEQASGLLRGALGLEGALPCLQQPAAVCHNLDSAMVCDALSALADSGHAQDLALPLLAAIQQKAPRVRIDAATQRKLMSPSVAADRGGQGWKGHGKGRGNGRWDRY